MTLGGADFHPDLASKAAALGFARIKNYPFVDGNKRVGHAALETFLVVNGFELQGDIHDAKRVVLAVAAADCGRQEFERWPRSSMHPLND